MLNQNSYLNSLAQELALILNINQREALAILILARLGSQSAGVISRHLGINRNTVYSLLEKLSQKHLIKKQPTQTTTLFSACQTEELIELINLEQQNLEEKRSKLQALKPKIISLGVSQTESKKPQIIYYEGQNEVRTEIHRILESIPKNSELFGYVNVANRDTPEFQELWPKYYELRLKRKIFMKQISPDTSDCVAHARKDKQENRETRIIPFSHFPFEQDYEINILPDRLISIYLHPQKPSITIYKDEKLAKAQMTIFYNHWQSASYFQVKQSKPIKSLKLNLQSLNLKAKQIFSVIKKLPIETFRI